MGKMVGKVEGMMEKASVFLSGNPKVEAPHKIGKDGK